MIVSVNKRYPWSNLLKSIYPLTKKDKQYVVFGEMLIQTQHLQEKLESRNPPIDTWDLLINQGNSRLHQARVERGSGGFFFDVEIGVGVGEAEKLVQKGVFFGGC